MQIRALNSIWLNGAMGIYQIIGLEKHYRDYSFLSQCTLLCHKAFYFYFLCLLVKRNLKGNDSQCGTDIDLKYYRIHTNAARNPIDLLYFTFITVLKFKQTLMHTDE